jgi:nucleoside-diphosphate-sugar epimerase
MAAIKEREILVTGAAGFISHVTRRLLWQGFCVVGVDSMTQYCVQR